MAAGLGVCRCATACKSPTTLWLAAEPDQVSDGAVLLHWYCIMAPGKKRQPARGLLGRVRPGSWGADESRPDESLTMSVACHNVNTLEPTLVPKALATSLLPVGVHSSVAG